MRGIGDLPDSGYSFKMGLLLVNKVREMEVKIKICKILTYVNQQLVYIRLGVQTWNEREMDEERNYQYFLNNLN
jgi:hypothetical protein